MAHQDYLYSNSSMVKNSKRAVSERVSDSGGLERSKKLMLVVEVEHGGRRSPLIGYLFKPHSLRACLSSDSPLDGACMVPRTAPQHTSGGADKEWFRLIDLLFHSVV